MNSTGLKLSSMVLLLLTAGCAVGYNSALFATKTNVGLDVDSTPPTAEISIARREVVIAPVFEGGQTPPVMASFSATSNPFSRLFFGVDSTFAGGDAAVALSQTGSPSSSHENKDGNWPPEIPKPPPGTGASRICLSQKELDVSIPGKGQVRPLLFGTDSTLGIKIAWSGMTAQMPDTVRLGFNRKEFALAPLFGSESCPCMLPASHRTGAYSVDISSFLAVLENRNFVGPPSETGFTWRQYIATGASATTLANQQEFRKLFMERATPAPFKTIRVDPNDPSVICIKEWKKDLDHANELKAWWKEKGYQGLADIEIEGDSRDQKEQREAFIKDKKIPCK